LIEIHVGSEVAGRNTHRLAVFGPGCIFGEIAMLTGGSRSASAVCVKPARLYVLRRDALRELQEQHPIIHGKIIANLSLHLATRVVATTEIVRGG
jgi:CRP-like cAMP-binding protein